MVAVIDGIAASQQEKELVLNQQVTEIEFQAGAIVIDNDEEYQAAADFGRTLKQRASDVKDFWAPMKDAAHKAHAEICNKEKAMLQPLVNAEKILKQTMGDYVAEQERKRREAEEAARKAAKEEAERKIQEAIALEESGDQTAAEAAVEEAEIMDNVAASVSVASAKPKATGVSTKKDWEIVSIDSEKVPTTVMGIDIRPVNTAAVMRLIRMSKGQVSIPGIRFEEKVQMSFRK
jgi:hypothetical protein